MEIKQEKPAGRMRLLWLLLVVNIVLIAGVWQYHRLIVELTDGAATGLYQRLLNPFKRGELPKRQPLRVALLQSEATAASFGDYREGYYNLIGMWQQFMDREGFGYQTVSQVPQGDDAKPYNLLLLPAARCLGEEDRLAVKAFLQAGKGVVMTWAAGTRNEYGQWSKYSLLHEVGGMDIVGAPPISNGRKSRVMLSGGYPITANLYPGMQLDITAFDHPVSCFVREDRTEVDGVWTDMEDPSFELHSVRDRAAVTHGTYFDGRFVWTGFTIGSSPEVPSQREAFFQMLRSSMLWAGHQAQAFKPVWPDAQTAVLAITQDVHGPEDVKPRVLEMARRQRVPLTSFVSPDAFIQYPDLLAQLQSAGEVAVLGDPELDYEGRSRAELLEEFKQKHALLQSLTGEAPKGFRLPGGRPFSEHTYDALVRAGYMYISTRNFDRMVPKATRSYRRIRLITRPRTFWSMPEMPYVDVQPGVEPRNTMTAHFSQIRSLGGFYCLSFRPSEMDAVFLEQLNTLMTLAKREKILIAKVSEVCRFWEGWDHIKVATRHLSSSRVSLKISNTWFEPVRDVAVNLEMPNVQRQLDITSMTLGTELPDRMTSSGIRWRLVLEQLGPGKNVTYYVNTTPMDAQETKAVEQADRRRVDVW